jgi:hypothetical protein
VGVKQESSKVRGRAEMLPETLNILAALFSLTYLSDSERDAWSRISETEAQSFVRYTYRECKNSPVAARVLSELVERAHASDLSLAFWVREVVSVYRWLEERDLQAKLGDIIEYVSCACEGSSLQAGHNINWYLDNYGFAGAVAA